MNCRGETLDIVYKTKEELEKLNTNRLLTYYKTYRSKYRFTNYCLLSELEGEEKEYEMYLLMVKEILNKREHIE